MYTTGNIPANEDDKVTKVDLGRWEHLSRIDIPDCLGEPEILIGINSPMATEPLEVIRSPIENGPYAMRNRLGWIICGDRIKQNSIKVTMESK